MTISGFIQTIVAAGAVLLVGAVLLGLNRKKLAPKAPVAATVASVIIVIAAINATASIVGFIVFASPIWLMLGAFVGFIWVQSSPLTVPSLLRGLALACAFAAIYAALASELLPTILALGVTGVLLKLSQSGQSTPGHSSDAV
jgi:hypothetical protein